MYIQDERQSVGADISYAADESWHGAGGDSSVGGGGVGGSPARRMEAQIERLTDALVRC